MRASRPELLWIPLVLAALLAIYLPGLGNALVFDDGYLATGELFSDYRSALEVRARMLSYGSFVWLQALAGEGWWKQRVANLVIHCGVVVALWALYRQILAHIEVASEDGVTTSRGSYVQSPALGVAIACFALNPVSVYAVAYLIQRSILMATFFVVLGLWLFARGIVERKQHLFALALVCYVLAVMSKEHAILAPLAAIPLYILIARPSAARLATLTVIGMAIVGLVGFILAKRYGEILGKPFDEYSQIYIAQLAALNPEAGKNPFLLSILNQGYLFFHYALRWLFPVSGWLSINLRPPFPVTVGTFPQILGIFGYLAVLAGGFFLLLRHRDWRALLGISILMPTLLFATEFATVWVQDPFVLYRSYLWAIGLPGFVFLALHGPSARTVAIIGLVLGALLTWQSLDRVWSLSTVETAWTDAIRKLPNDPRSVGRWFPYLNRGSFYVDQNQFKLAVRDFETSSTLGDAGMGALNMGSVLSAEGKHGEALKAFDEAERQGYKLYNLPFQRGQSLARLNRPGEAYVQFQAAAAMNPPSPTRELVLIQLGRFGMQLGKPEEAVRYLEQLRIADPRHREGAFTLAMAYVMKHDYAKARELADKIAKEEPASGRALYARALANYGLKRKAEAAADIDAALRLNPDIPGGRGWQEKIKAMP